MAARFLIMNNERALRRERVFRDRFNPLENFPESVIRDTYRFFPRTVYFICDLVKDRITHPTQRSKAIPVLLQVLIALRFFATGSYQSVIGDTLNISKASVCRCVREVSLALEAVSGSFISFPKPSEEEDVKRRFFKLAAFPNVIGCIDGCLIKIKKPTVNAQEFMCRKGYPAINVQYTCLPDHRFSSIVAKWPGSCHDSRIFNESSLSTYLANGNHGILLGDSGYPNRPYLLTPVLGQAEEKYNNSHSKTRVKIEQAFGIMKNRFGCLLLGLRMTPERSVTIINAIAVLHNIAIENRDNFEPIILINEEDNIAQEVGQDAPAGLATRQYYINTFFS